jgi:hypothetical protein
VLSTCPVGWGMTPSEAMEHLANDVTAVYPLGTWVDRAKGVAPAMPMTMEAAKAAAAAALKTPEA